MNRDEVQYAVKLALNEGWTVSTYDFKELILHHPEGCFIGELGGRKIAMVFAVPYSDFGFIGNLIVEVPYRGKGIGMELMRHSLNHLENLGINSVMLDAVTAAIPLYKRLGFKPICKSFRLVCNSDGYVSHNVVQIDEEILKEVILLDTEIFGGDRTVFLESRYTTSPHLCRLLLNEGKIAAYVFGAHTKDSIRLGPLVIVDNSVSPQELVYDFFTQTNDKEVWLGSLENNHYALSLLSKIGFITRSFSCRMLYGPTTTATFSKKLIAIGHPGSG